MDHTVNCCLVTWAIIVGDPNSHPPPLVQATSPHIHTTQVCTTADLVSSTALQEHYYTIVNPAAAGLLSAAAPWPLGQPTLPTVQHQQ